eukprot:TRINITY_DN5342_c0_g1_i1.p1 TRINITY_DN5342_c0_g1~~TRINITY_DN5342_c0_g1_i1.p1  ORF type:complete len:782 (+),score=101.11 TRINITY_DN5342_c0_g1_i1:33-2378(+)
MKEVDYRYTLTEDISLDDSGTQPTVSSTSEEEEEVTLQDPLCQHLLFILLGLVFLFVLGSSIGGLIVTITRPPPPPSLPQPWKDFPEIVYSYTEPTFMPYIGNGYVATVVGSDTIYLSGVFNGDNEKNDTDTNSTSFGQTFFSGSHRAAFPGTNGISIKGERLGSALDMANATFYRRIIVGWANVEVEQRWYAHRLRRSLLVHEIFVNNSRNPEEQSIELSLNTRDSPDLVAEMLHVEYGSCYLSKWRTINSINGKQNVVAIATSPLPSILKVDPLTSKTFYFLTVLRSSLDSLNPTEDALHDFNEALKNVASLHQTHVQAWSQLWKSHVSLKPETFMKEKVLPDGTKVFEIESPGEEKISQDGTKVSEISLSSYYYLLSSLRIDWPLSLSSGSLSSNLNNGHTGWDTEIWMFPPLLLCSPDVAKSLLQYRVNRIGEANKIAASSGFSGIRFPFASGSSGREEQPQAGDHLHVTGDVAFAFQMYWRVTGDRAWLREVYPVILQMAQFWTEKAELVKSSSKYAIRNVTGINNEVQDNNIHTNAVAMMSIKFAIEATKTLQKPDLPEYFSKISENIIIQENEDHTIHQESSGDRGDKILMAETMLLSHPLDFPMSESMRENDVWSYNSRTDHSDVSNTASFLINWLKIDNKPSADQLWPKIWKDHTIEPFHIWTRNEKETNYITGAGAFLQTLLFGYGGIQVKETRLLFRPQLPPNIAEVVFNELHYKGAAFRIIYNMTHVTATSTRRGISTLYLNDASGIVHPLVLEREIVFFSGPFEVYSA